MSPKPLGSAVFQRVGFGLKRSVQLDIDAFQNGGQIGCDLRVPESNNAIAFVLEPALAFEVSFGDIILVVMPAIELDDQALCWTEEVDDVSTDRSLPAEVRAPSIGKSLRARHSLRSCGVVLALSFFAAARRINVENIFAASSYPASPCDSHIASRPSPFSGG